LTRFAVLDAVGWSLPTRRPYDSGFEVEGLPFTHRARVRRNMQQTQLGMRWDLASPFFREALRKGDTSAQHHLYDAIEQGFKALGCGLENQKRLVHTVASSFVTLIIHPTVVAYDTNMMAITNDERSIATERAQIDVIEKKITGQLERIESRKEMTA
jgi:hypothetical protein